MIKSGILYVVATPIGNLEDITLRAINILGTVNIILCEDTRHTGLLLNKYNLKGARLISYQEFNELQRIPEVIGLLLEGKTIALVSDAGTPLIADPGYKLINECIKRNIKVVPIPGPSAFVTALSVSGLPTTSVFFIGYLPKQKGKRQKTLASLPKATIVCYETPHRLIETLDDIYSVFGEIEIVIARELTKIHEEVFTGNITEALNHFKNPKGEFVLVFFKS